MQELKFTLLLGQCQHHSLVAHESQVSRKRFLGFLSGGLQQT